MADTAITFTVSQDAARYVKTDADGAPDLRERAMLLYPAIADMTISHGRAAELLGIPKWDLIDLYAGMGIPYLTQTWEEAQEDSRAIEEAMRQDESRPGIFAAIANLFKPKPRLVPAHTR